MNEKHQDIAENNETKPVDELIDPKLKQEAAGAFSWVSIAKAFVILGTVVGTVGGLALHMMGYLSYQAYFTEWGIDPGLFPHSTDAIIINGFYALADRIVAIFSIADKNIYLAIATGLTLYLFTIMRIDKLGERYRRNRRFPEWLTDLAKSLLMTSVAMGIVPFAVVIIVIVLITPAALGEKAGHSLAEHQMKSYLAGCNQKGVKDKCIEIRKNGKPFARGFLIEGSESHIALFDVTKMRARAFEREGTELLVDTPRELTESGKVKQP